MTFLDFVFLLTVCSVSYHKTQNASEFVLCFVSLVVLKKQMAQSNPEPFSLVYSSFFFYEHRLQGQPINYSINPF
jgi:hypothetical protein